MRINKKDVASVLIFIALILAFVLLVNNITNKNSGRELQIVRDAVKNAALTCYAVEGMYPDDLEYLREHYNLSYNETIQSVFVLLLLSLFACLSTFLVTIGAQIYRHTVDSAEENSNSRIMTAVVRSAVWAEDGGEVKIEKFEDLGITSLTIVNDYDGEKYYKRLYCAMDPDPLDGEPRSYLWESFSSEETEFTAENGESLCELNGFEPSIDGETLKVDLESPNGTKSTIRIAMRTGGAAE